MSWHKLTLKVIDVLALLGHRCLGTHHIVHKDFGKSKIEEKIYFNIVVCLIYGELYDLKISFFLFYSELHINMFH